MEWCSVDEDLRKQMIVSAVASGSVRTLGAESAEELCSGSWFRLQNAAEFPL